MSKKSKYIFFIFCLLSSSVLLSQENDDKPLFNFSSPIDTLYRQRLFDYFQLKTDISANIVSYSIANNSDKFYILNPNERYLMRLSVDFKFLGFTVYFTPSFLPENKDEDLKGDTKYVSYATRFNLGRTFNEFSFTKIRGYYFEDEEAEYIILPNYATRAFSAKTSYIIGSKYSLRAVKTQTERQIKSAGTFIPSFKFDYVKHTLSQDDAAKLDIDYFNYLKRVNVTLTGGYHHTWVFNKSFFFGGALDPGFGLSFMEREAEISESDTEVIVNMGLKLNLGYNAKRFFTGLEFEYQEAYFSTTQFIDQRSQNSFQLYVGYRFDIPKKIKKPFDWFERKTGL